MDLDIKRVLAARPDAPVKESLAPLVTPWGESLDPGSVRAEHPRPQFERSTWTSLNGWWDYAIRESSDAGRLWGCAPAPERWDAQILVPFSPEAQLSGVGRQLLPCQLLWYRRSFMWEPRRRASRALLHFEAVDYACACYVNGKRVGTHVGGYLPFEIDISDVVVRGENCVELCVYDPSETGVQLRGKQRLARGNMWYTAQSGIWQPVWLEELAERHIVSVSLAADADAGILQIEATLNQSGELLRVELFDAEGADRLGVAEIQADTCLCHCTIQLDDPHLWGPDDPYLYRVGLSYGEDEVSSYCAFRTVGIETDGQGVARFCLNHRPFFIRGLLDQGYWPDGLMTAPADEAMVADIAAAREAGFNTLRKHIKIEPSRWYWHCDRMGMLVIQDMVSGGDLPREWESVNIPTLLRRSWSTLPDSSPRQWRRFGAADAAYRAEWERTAQAAIARLAAHPSIVAWTVFNESWGQFSSAEKCEELREIDDTRPFIAASGWYDQGAGDFFAVHNYFRGMRVYHDPYRGLLSGPQPRRAFIIDEFGGLTCSVAGHVSVSRTYGYDAYPNLASWREAFYELLERVCALKEDGLAGFVYTQLTDVEEETNGLLTYDRRIRKWEQGL